MCGFPHLTIAASVSGREPEGIALPDTGHSIPCALGPDHTFLQPPPGIRQHAALAGLRAGMKGAVLHHDGCRCEEVLGGRRDAWVRFGRDDEIDEASLQV